jgi:hypothetical protein
LDISAESIARQSKLINTVVFPLYFQKEQESDKEDRFFADTAIFPDILHEIYENINLKMMWSVLLLFHPDKYYKLLLHYP